MPKSSQLHGDLVFQGFASAVETYRRSLDIYRHVVALRVRREARLQEVRVGATPPPPPRLAVLKPRQPKLDPLTPREREVAGLIARGYSNQQIAATLILTRGTVANHVAHILNKLGATNRTQVASLVLQPSSEIQSAAAD